MATNGGEIRFGIGFDVNKSGLNDLKKSLQDIQKATTKDLTGDLGGKSAQEALTKIKQSASQVEQALRKAYNPTIGTTNLTKFNQQLNKTGINLNTVYQEFSRIGIKGQTAFTQLASNILTTNVKLKQTHSLLDSMGQTMVNTVKWGIASSIMNSFSGSIRNAYNYIKVLDSSLTDIRIVTGQSREEMDRFADSANKTAQNLGRQTKDYTNAALSFYQQGLSDDQVAARTEITLKAANITGAAVSDMANQLTAVWNGFQVSMENAQDVVSKLAAIADSSASNMSQLATAMSKTASVANNMGVDVDQLGAQIATIIATTRQAPETVGNALKTIYSRINDIKAGSDEAQISLGNYTGKMAALGIQVLDQEGHLRETGQVMEQIGERWSSMTHEQQVYLAQTMAGQRQMNILMSLFQNWDTYTKELNISLEAQGTLDEKNARYMESLAAHTNQLAAAGEGVIQSFADSDSFKGFIDAGTQALKLLTNIIDSIGGGGTALLALGSIFTTIFRGTISKEINSLITGFQNAKYNAEQLNLVIQNTKAFASIEGIQDDTAIQAMIDKQTETQKYYSVMSQSEINHQNNLIKELGLAEQNKAIWDENVKTAQSYAQTIMKDSSFNVLDKNEESLWKINVRLNDIDGLIKQVNKSYVALAKVNPKLSGLTGASQELKNLKGYINDLIKATGASGPEVDRLTQAFSVLGKQGKLSESEISALKTAVQDFLKVANSKQDQLRETLEVDTEKANELLATIEHLRTAIDTNNKGFAQRLNVKDITTAVGAVGQLASAINGLTNIPKIINDKDLADGEKLLQVITSIGFSLPFLISSISKLNKVMGNQSSLLDVIKAKRAASLAQQKAIIAQQKVEIAIKNSDWKATRLQKEATEANTVAVQKAKVAQDQLNASVLMNPWTWVILALTAAIVAYTAYSDHVRKVAEEQLERAKASAESKKQILADKEEQRKKVQQLYNSYKDLKSQYLEGSQSLQDYQNAVSDLLEQQGYHNEAVQALVSSYEQLDEIMNGVRQDANNQTIAAAKETQEATKKAIINQVAVSNAKDKPTGAKVADFLQGMLNPRQAAADILANQFTGRNKTQLYYDTGATTSKEEAAFFNEFMATIGAENRLSPGLQRSKGYFDMQANVDATIQKYDQLQKVLQKYEKELSDNNIYKEFSQYLTAIAPLTQDFESAVTTIQQGELDNAVVREKIALEAIDSQETFNEAYDKLVNDFIKIGLSASQAASEANKRLRKEFPAEDFFDFNKFLENKITDDQIQKAYWTINSEVQDYLENELSDDERRAVFRLGIEFEGKTVPEAALEAKKGLDQIDAQLNSQVINLTDNVSSLLMEKQGKKLTKDDKTKIEQLMYTEGLTDQQRERLSVLNDENATLSQQLQVLQEIRSTRSDQNFSAASTAKSSTGESLVLQEAALHQRIKKLEEVKKQAEESLKVAFSSEDIVHLNEQIVNATNEIETLKQQIEDFDWTIHLDVDGIESNILAGFRGEVQNLTEDSYLLAQAATSIGQGYQVAAKDFATLTSIFPEITENAYDAGNGIIQLDEEIVKQVLGNNSAILESDAEVTRNKLQGQVDILNAEIAYCDQRLDILDQVLAGEISQSEASQQLTEAKATFEQNMSNATGKSWVQAQAQATQANADSVNTVIANLQGLGATAVAVGQAVAAALAGQVSDYKPGGFTASGGSGGSFEQSSNVSAFAAKNGLGAEQAANRVKEIQAQRDAIQQERDSAEKLKNNYLDLMAKTTEKTTEAMNKADYASQGLGGSYDPSKSKGGGGGGGGKDKTKSADQIDKKKLKDTQIDKYHELDRAIKDVENSIKKLDKAQKKTIRNGLSKTIDNQVAALEAQKGLYQEKIGLMQSDLQLQRAQLQALDVQFDEQGNIINYTGMMIAYQQLYNQLLEQAKLLTGDQQQAKLKQADALKTRLDNLKTQMNAYEALQDKITAAGDAIQDILDKEEELRIKQFKIKIDWQLDKAEVERDWNAFRSKVIDEVKDDDYLGQAKARLQDFYSYYKEDGGGIIQELTEHVNKTRREAEIIENGGTSAIYGKNQAQALEDLKHYTDQLMQNLEDVKDLEEEIHDLYLDTIDKANDAFDEQIKTYEQIRDIIQHNLNLIQMLHPQNNEEQLARYYELRRQNDNQQIDFYRKEVDMWKRQMDAAQEGTEEWKKFRDNWMEAVSDMNSAVEDAVQNLLDKYHNAISKIIRETKDQVLGGDWQKALDEWDRAKWFDDRYLDIASRGNGVLDFISNVNQAMNGASSKQQKDLLALMDAQVDRLNKMTRVRQIDLDIANKKLEALQKQYALEQAQQNKTQMRLRRDSQGNYTYQYVADESSIEGKQQELRDVLEELRLLAKEDLTDTIDTVEEKLTEFFTKAQELSQLYYDDTDLLQQKLLELQEEYWGEEGYITMLGIDYNLMQGQLLEATAAQFSQMYRQQGEELAAFLGLNTDDQNENSVWASIKALIGADGGAVPSLLEIFTTQVIPDNFNLISAENQALLFGPTGLNPSWNTALGSMTYAVGQFALTYGDAGKFVFDVTSQIIIPAIQTMIDTTRQYAQDLNTLQQIAGISFSGISQGIDYTIGQTAALVQNNAQLISTYDAEVTAVGNVCAQLKALREDYYDVAQAAMVAAAAALTAYAAMQGVAADYTPRTVQRTSGKVSSIAQNPINSNTGTGGSGNNSGGVTSKRGTSETPKSPEKTKSVTSVYGGQHNGQVASWEGTYGTGTINKYWYENAPVTVSGITPTNDNTIYYLTSPAQATATQQWLFGSNTSSATKVNTGPSSHSTTSYSSALSTATAVQSFLGGSRLSSGPSSHSTTSHNSVPLNQSPVIKLQPYDTYTGVQQYGIGQIGDSGKTQYEKQQHEVIISDSDELKHIRGYATGGYTGAWANGDNKGRLAFLHQKQLVLNPEDTANMLAAVDIVRGIMNDVSSLNFSMQNGLPTGGAYSSFSRNTDNSTSQNIVINADFPNVSDALEIKQAFNSLVNIASQKANGNRRTY